MSTTSKHTFISPAQEKLIIRNKAAIIENLDTSGIFLDVLLGANLYSPEFHSKLLSFQSDIARTTHLLDYILKCSQESLAEFIRILKEQRQTHVAELLELEESQLTVQGNDQNTICTSTQLAIYARPDQGSEHLMSEEQRSRIESNRPMIIKYLHIEDTFLNKLQSYNIVSSEILSLIHCLPMDTHKNTALLGYVLKLSQERLEIFIGILNEENQSHVADLFKIDIESSALPCATDENRSLALPHADEESRILALPHADEESRILALPHADVESRILALPHADIDSRSLALPHADIESRSIALPHADIESRSLDLYHFTAKNRNQLVQCRKRNIHAGRKQLIPELHMMQIEKNRPNIIRYLHIEESLLNTLQAEKIITSGFATQIRCLPVDEQKNTKFLECLLELSPKQMNHFIQILSSENQSHVAELFRYNQDECQHGPEDKDSNILPEIATLALPYAAAESGSEPGLREQGQLNMCINCVVRQKANLNDTKAQLLEKQNKVELNLYDMMNNSLEKLKCAKSKEEEKEHKTSFEFYKKSLIEIKELLRGSIIWTLIFSSVDSLDTFWEVYNNGLLQEMLQKDFVTEELLDEFQLESVELHISINPQEYIMCKEELQGFEKRIKSDDPAMQMTSGLTPGTSSDNIPFSEDPEEGDSQTRAISSQEEASGFGEKAEIQMIENQLKIYKKDKKQTGKAVLTTGRWQHYQEKISPPQVQKVYMKTVYLMNCMELFGFISKCKGITELFLYELQDSSGHNEYIVKGLSHALSRLTQLKAFDLWSTYLGKQGIDVLCSLSSTLRVLSLENSNIAGCGGVLIGCLTRIPKLGYLNLNRSGLDKEETKGVLSILPKRCPRLSGLLLGDLDLTGVGLDQAVQNLPELRALSFKKAVIPKLEFMHIIGNTNENIELLGLLHVKGTQKKLDSKLMCDLLGKRKKLKFVHMSEDQLGGGFLGWYKISSALTKNGGHLLSDASPEDKKWQEYFAEFTKIVNYCINKM